MPLTPKEEKIKQNFIKQYGLKLGTKYFYASENKGKFGLKKRKKRSKVSK